MGEYIQNLPADLWVGQAGSRDMFHSVSILSLQDEERIKAVDGVKEVASFSGRQLLFRIKGEEVPTYIVGYDVARGVGGPLRVIEGKDRPSKGEIIIDTVLAKNKKIRMGDTLKIGEEEEFRVSGISEGGNVILYQYSFIIKEDAERLFKLENVTNYFLITLESDADRMAVAKKIEEAVAGVNVFTKEAFVNKNSEIIRETFLPIILVLSLIGFAVGVMVIGLMIFTATIEKSREYGVLKAIGFKNRQLYILVVEQALILSSVGYAIGVVFALGTSVVLGEFIAEFVTYFRISDVAAVFGASILMAVFAAYVPARKIARINPAEVFKS